MNILDGKLVSGKILDDIKIKIDNNNLNIGLGIIVIGDDEASNIYVKNKIKSCEKVGIVPYLYKLDATVSEFEVINLIEKINNDNNIHGLILQSPTPSSIDFKKCAALISSNKDIDGLGMENTYDNYLNKEALLPCTVKGIIDLLGNYNIDIKSKDIVIVGKGNLVGKPLMLALLNLGATVTVCHSKTNNLKEKCINADILISATGKTHLIDRSFVKEGAVVVDVGINKIDGKLCGDVNFEDVKDKAAYITPVPGGVGPMTVASLLSNVVLAYERGNNG